MNICELIEIANNHINYSDESENKNEIQSLSTVNIQKNTDCLKDLYEDEKSNSNDEDETNKCDLNEYSCDKESENKLSMESQQQDEQLNDDNFDHLSHLERFFKLCDAQKLDTSIKYILAALESCTTHDEYMRIFANLRNACFSNDIVVRSMWIEQIPNVVQYLYSKNILDENLKIELSLVISNLIQFTSYQVRRIASTALLTLIERELIEINKIEQYIVPCLLNLVNENNDDIHIECVALFGKLAPLLGRELTVKHLLVPFCRLCASPAFHTRKTCATNIGEIAVVVSSKEVEEFLLPHFSEFTKDQVWAIRKVCAETFSTFANKCTRETREKILTECFIRLLEDNSRWVKISAYKSLGAFIATFLKNENDHLIIDANKVQIKNENAENKSQNSDSNKDSSDAQNSNENNLKSEEDFSNFVYWRGTLPDVRLDDNDESKDGNLEKKSEIKKQDDKDQTLEEVERKKHEEFLRNFVDEEYTEMDAFVDRVFAGECTIDDEPKNPNRPAKRPVRKNANLNLNIELIEQNIVPPKLLSYFITMVDINAQICIDSEMNYNCAFNFPAIAYTLGASSWKYLRNLYKKLAEDFNWKVRQTLAYSIHELAQILGTEVTQIDLVPIFDSYIKDVDEVRIGIVSNLSKFLKILTSDYRRLYLPKFVDILKMDNHRNWRFRSELASQICEFCELYSCEDVANSIQPIAFTLALDKVYEVRMTAVQALSKILKQFVSNNEKVLRKNFVENCVKTFANNDKWSSRQMFIFLCLNILNEQADELNLFSQDFLPYLLAFRNDKVPNIRLCLARLISNYILNIEFFKTSNNLYENEISLTVQCLRNDTDNDVKSFFIQEKPMSDDSIDNSTVFNHSNESIDEPRIDDAQHSNNDTNNKKLKIFITDTDINQNQHENHINIDPVL